MNTIGKRTLQPFWNQGIFGLHNGDIYNYERFGEFSTDGEVLLPLYIEYGPLFPRLLDGEFSLAVFDFNVDKGMPIIDLNQ